MPKKIIITEEQFEKVFGGKFIIENHSIDDIFNQERTPLLEAYYATYPIDKVKRFVMKHFVLTDDYNEFRDNRDKYQGYISIDEAENDEQFLNVVFPKGEIPLLKLNNALSLCGYFESTVKDYGRLDGISYSIICFEKRHEKNVNEKVHQYKFLYHVTTKNKEEKIRKNGLAPKANNKICNHPERIYFIPSNKPINESMYILYRVGKMLYPNEEDFIACGVETNRLSCNFYYDPNLQNAVYITENINPELLRIQDIRIRK